MLGASFSALADAFATDPSVDLTDDSGHGVIFCGQKVYLSITFTTPLVGSTANTNAYSVKYGARILFRWKNVSLTEYIGVVTSQLAQ